MGAGKERPWTRDRVGRLYDQPENFGHPGSAHPGEQHEWEVDEDDEQTPPACLGCTLTADQVEAEVRKRKGRMTKKPTETSRIIDFANASRLVDLASEGSFAGEEGRALRNEALRWRALALVLAESVSAPHIASALNAIDLAKRGMPIQPVICASCLDAKHGDSQRPCCPDVRCECPCRVTPHKGRKS